MTVFFNNMVNGLPDVFIKLVNLSITASWLVIAILLFKLLARKVPKWIHCALWGLVGLRLVFPISLESIFSLVPSAETFDSEFVQSRQFEIHSGLDGLDRSVNEYMGSRYYEGVTVASNFKYDVTKLLAVIWLIGVLVMLVYAFGSYLRLKAELKTAVPMEGTRIRQSEKVGSPFVLGLFRPVIYLPFGMKDGDMRYVVAHEMAHIKRKDHWIKPIGFMLLAVYWFNPILWAAYILLCKDIEMACDEKVIRSLDTEERQDYSIALLHCSLKRYRIAACPLAFGEVSVKERIKSVMSYKKPAFWITMVGVISCVVIAVCFLTNPKEKLLHAPDPFCHSYRAEELVYDDLQYSFTFTEETMPVFSLSSDYVLSVKYAGFESEQINGGFQEVKLTRDNFDNYLRWEEKAGADYRKSNKKTWRLDVSDDVAEEGRSIFEHEEMFYYLMLQKNGDVYLAVGYDSPWRDSALIRWMFKLDRIDLVDTRVHTEGASWTLGSVWYPESESKVDYNDLARATVYESGEIELKVDFACDELTVEAEYFEYTLNGSNIHHNTYTLSREADGSFLLPIERKGTLQKEFAVYSVMTPNGKCAFAVDFPAASSEAPEAEDAVNIDSIYLEEFLSNVILAQNSGGEPDGLINVESHVTLLTDVYGYTPAAGKVLRSAYVVACYKEYSSYGGVLEEKGGSQMPVIIIYSGGTDGNYIFEDYRTPGAGSYYVKDIKANFPESILEDALDSQKYAKELSQACEEKARAILEEKTVIDETIARLLEEISSLPLHASMPQEFSKAQDDKYKELLSYREYTLQYCFEEFLKGGQTDLRGHIMAQLCEEIMLDMGEGVLIDGEIPTGQDWFDEFYELAHSQKENYERANSLYILEKYYPGTWLLLRIE